MASFKFTDIEHEGMNILCGILASDSEARSGPSDAVTGWNPHDDLGPGSPSTSLTSGFLPTYDVVRQTYDIV